MTAPTTPPLRVALLCHYPDDDVAPAGGVWSVGRNLAAGLVNAGAEVHVVRYKAASDGAARVHVRGVSPLIVHTVELPRRRTQPFRRVDAVPALVARLREIRPDAVTAHESEYGLAAVRSGLPAAVTIHGMPRQEFRAFRWQNRLDLAVTLWQDWQMVRRAQDIVAINDYAIGQYRGRTNARFHRINIPIGEVFFTAPPREPDPHSVLMVEGMNERKDPITMIRAIAQVRQRIPDARLDIAGRLPAGPYGEKVRETIAELALDDCVTFIGLVDQPELAGLYASHAALALSSRQETSPCVIAEAMAGRRPVVATDVGGVREMVSEDESGYVVPAGDPQTLAERIAAVLNDSLLARRFGEHGRWLAEQRYRRNVIGRQYVELLEGLARKNTLDTPAGK
ncbi:MAG: glycosyltransferase family 4 protein [Anaerolineae bacterium]|nr:glycosyltransferase family 4 protein [Anaerolineae bacterium]